MATKHFFSLSALFLSAFFLVTVGCSGEVKAPVPKGPIDTTIASQLQGRTRISNSEKYSATHEY
jgi:hypothetical protein